MTMIHVLSISTPSCVNDTMLWAQDNNFAEALKLPNLLGEFDQHDDEVASGRSIDDIACVGFREWIFSEDAGDHNRGEPR